MITAVDSSVLFDIVKGAPGAKAAHAALEAACGMGSICACEAVVVELGRYFGKTADMQAFFADCQLAYSPMSLDAALAASRTMRAYSANKGPRTRVTADFLIGAHALTQADALLTTDAGFFRSYFKGLRVDQPAG